MASRLSRRQQAKIGQRQKQTISRQQQAQQAQQIKTKVQQTKENLDKLRGELLAAERQRDLAFQAVNRSGLFGRARRNSPEFQKFIEAESKVKKLRPQFDAAKRSFAVAREQEDIATRGVSRVGFGKKPKPKTARKDLVQINATLSGGVETIKTTRGGKTTITRNIKKVKVPKVLTSSFNVRQTKVKKQKDLLSSAATLKQFANQNESNLLNKAISGQTLTPKQQREYNKFLQDNADKIDKKQLTSIKNAPKDVGKGFYEVGKEVVGLAVGSVKGAYKYGETLVDRFEAGENNPLFNDVKKLGKGTVSVASLVKNNPTKAAVIVGAAGAQVGRDFSSAFVKNPVKTTTKAVLYLFPGKVIGGISKAAKTTGKTAKTAIQAKRATALKTKTAGLKNLSPKQRNLLDRTIKNAAKSSKAKIRTDKVKATLRKILREKGVTPKRGATIPTLKKQINLAKRQPLKVISTKPKLKKSRSKADITLTELKRAKISIDGKAQLVKKSNRKRNTYYRVKGNSVQRITLKEYKKLLPKKKPGRPRTKPIIKKLDITKESSQALKRQLKSKGVVKQRGVTYIDLNAVKRIESAKTPVKVVTKKGLLANKKAQVRFRVQTQSLVMKQKRIVSDTKAIVRQLKSAKKPNKRIIKSRIKKLKLAKSKLIKLKNIIKSLGPKSIRLVGVVKLIDSLIKAIVATQKDLGKLPKPGQAQPSKGKGKGKGKAQPQKPGQGQKPGTAQRKATKPKTGQKLLNKSASKKKIVKKPKAAKKPLKIPRIRISQKLPKSKTLRTGYQIIIKEGNRIVAQSTTLLPLNRAKNILRQRLDNTPQASGNIKPIGKTNIIDVKAKKNNKFRIKRSKGTKVLRVVEKKKFRLDTPGEKKGLKAAKKRKVKSKSKPKTNPAARKVFKTKKAAQLKGYSVYKVKGGWKRRKL